MKTAKQLGEFALWVFNEEWLYGYGCYGQRLQTHYSTLKRSRYYVENSSSLKDLTAAYNAGKNPRLYDCHGIVDGFRMDDPYTAEIEFDSSLDISANYEMSKVKSLGLRYFSPRTDFKDNMGWGYWKDGHFGVGVGNGEVVDIWWSGHPARKRGQMLGNWTYCLQCYGIDYSEETDMLQKGSKGDAVKAWQTRLIEWDTNALPRFKADGDFGSETEEWTDKFKDYAELEQNGIVDDITWNAMVEALRGVDQSVVDSLKKQVAALEISAEVANAKALSAESAYNALDKQFEALGMELADKESDIRELVDSFNTIQEIADSYKA